MAHQPKIIYPDYIATDFWEDQFDKEIATNSSYQEEAIEQESHRPSQNITETVN